MNKKRILFIVRTYCAPDVRVERETRSLHNNGYQVTTFCLWDKSLAKSQSWNGGNIERIVHVPMNGDKSVCKKIYSIVLFALITIFRGRSFDIIHCNDLDMLPIGVFLKWATFGRIKVIYDAHEYETERFHNDGLIKKIAKITERIFIRHADKTLTVSNAIADEYVRLHNIKKPVVILNCPHLKPLVKSTKLREALGFKNDVMIFLYQGGLFPNRGIEQIIEAFERLEDNDKIVIFMGFGALETFVKAKANLNKNIFFHPAVTTDVLHEYTSSADIGILYYENTCLNHYYCSPNKLFEYTMAGLPIIASNLFEMNRFIQNHDNGFVTEHNSAINLYNIIKSYDWVIQKKQKENALKLREIYSWEKQENYLINAYNEISNS